MEPLTYVASSVLILLICGLVLVQNSEAAVAAYVNWGDYDIHGGLDYEWFDPYETESLFTDYKGLVTELYKDPEDGIQFNKRFVFKN